MTARPTCLPVQFDNIPIELKKTPRWVLWRLLEKGDENNTSWAKLPTQTNGMPASSTNPDHWTDFISVQDAYQSNPTKFAGIGFVFTQEDNLVGVDLDDCYDQHIGFTNAAMQHIAESIEGYMEVSPSGTGVKIFTRAEQFASHADHAIGFEAYATGRYFTVTGHHLSGSVPAVVQDLTSHIPERTLQRTGDAFGDYTAPLEDWDITRVETELLDNYHDYGYEAWLKVGMIMHHQFGGDIEACEAWDRWSAKGENYHTNACYDKWRTF
jgi:primase-polymerase (primpol)-like protein